MYVLSTNSNGIKSFAKIKEDSTDRGGGIKCLLPQVKEIVLLEHLVALSKFLTLISH